MTVPFLSVVVPVKADPGGLQRTLESIPHSPLVELLVVDAGGCDATRSLLEQMAARLAHRESGLDTGIANAMNRGINKATGTFVAILNAGDEWVGDTVEQLQSAATRHPDAEVLYGSIRFKRADQSTYVVHPDLSRMHQRMWLFHPSLFVKRDTYARLGGYDESFKLAMDSEWCHRAIASGVCMEQVDAVLACMELGGRSDTRYVSALAEFRRSVVAHRLTNPIAAWVWFCVVATGKAVKGWVGR